MYEIEQHECQCQNPLICRSGYWECVSRSEYSFQDRLEFTYRKDCCGYCRGIVYLATKLFWDVNDIRIRKRR